MSQLSMRMFAGPNGSGKSYLVNQLREQKISIDPVVNSDELLTVLSKSGMIDLKSFGLKHVTNEDWNNAIETIQELKTRMQLASGAAPVSISNNLLVCNKENFSEKNIRENAYLPALIADFIRYKILQAKKSFSFETVMSHPGKVDFITIAKDKGYKTYLYYLATESVKINLQKVENRVEEGGHDVPDEKVVKRYGKSLDLLYPALKEVDRAYLIDTSKNKSEVILEKKNNGSINFYVDRPPRWVEEHVVSYLHS